MFKSNLIKYLSLLFVSSMVIIGCNSSSSDLQALKNDLEIIQQEYNEFASFIYKYNNQSASGKLTYELNLQARNNRNYQISGISNDTENKVLKETYHQFALLKSQQEKLKSTILNLEDNDKVENKAQIKEIKNKLSNPAPDNNDILPQIQQLGYIINPMEDGKVTAEEVCQIQKYLQISGLTEKYNSGIKNTCGNFYGATYVKTKEKLLLETKQLGTNITEGISSLDKIKTEGVNSFTTIIKDMSLLIIILILVIDKVRDKKLIKKWKSNNEENKQLHLDRVRLQQERQQFEVENKQLQQKKQQLEADNKKLHQKNKQLEAENQRFHHVNQQFKYKLPILKSEQESQQNIVKKTYIQKITKKSSKSEQLTYYPKNSQELLRYGLRVRITEEIILNLWKGVSDVITLEIYEKGDYVIMRGSNVKLGDYLFLNPKSKITLEAVMLWQKSKLFICLGSIESWNNIIVQKPATVVPDNSENKWILKESGEILFS